MAIPAFEKVQNLPISPEIEVLLERLKAKNDKGEHYAAAYNSCLILIHTYGHSTYTRAECKKTMKSRGAPFETEEMDRLLNLSIFKRIAAAVKGKTWASWPVGDEFKNKERLQQLLRVIHQTKAKISDEAFEEWRQILSPESQAMSEANKVTKEYMENGSREYSFKESTSIGRQHAVLVIVGENKESGRAARKRIYSWEVRANTVTDAITCGFQEYASVHTSMKAQIEKADRNPMTWKNKGTGGRYLFKSRNSVIHKNGDEIAICKVQQGRELPSDLATALNISKTLKKGGRNPALQTDAP